MKIDRFRIATGLILCVFFAASARALEVDIPSAKDNTLYEDAEGDVSNGSGVHFFAGRVSASGEGKIRRGLLYFDINSYVPAGSVIEGVQLQLTMSKTNATDKSVTIHKVLADWGEGASDASGNEGGGTVATTNDATWTKRFFGTAQNWTTPGGDFNSAVSASTLVGSTGVYTWSAPQMLADVQSWSSNPATNFGWIVVGDESAAGTAKRFDSRENPTLANRPVLKVTYSDPSTVEDWVLY